MIADCEEDKLIGVRVVFLRREGTEGGIDDLFDIFFVHVATLAKAIASRKAWRGSIWALSSACDPW